MHTFIHSIYHSVIFSLIHSSQLYFLYFHAGVVEAKHRPGVSSHTKLVFAGRVGRAAEASRRKTRERKYFLCFVLYALVSGYRIVSLQWQYDSPYDAKTETWHSVQVVFNQGICIYWPLSFCIPFTSQCLLWAALECLFEALVQNHGESWPLNKLWEWNGQECEGEILQKATKATYIAMTYLQNSVIGTKWKILEINRSWSNSS